MSQKFDVSCEAGKQEEAISPAILLATYWEKLTALPAAVGAQGFSEVNLAC
jgi:hypothetical protein